MAFQYRFISPASRSSALLAPEEEGYLGDLAGAGSSLLGTVGSILDTPGRFIRTGLVGENPFASILDPDKGVSGRELLERAGLLSRNQEGFDFGDVLGFGAEIVTDPLTLVGGGTTKGGSIAKALGKYPKRSIFDVGTGALSVGKRTARRGTLGSVLEGADDATMAMAKQLAESKGSRLDDLLDQPMQQSLGFGIPFRENFATLDLPGAAGRAALLDRIGGKARQSWAGRELSRMFDRSVRNATSGKVQETATRFTEQVEPILAEEEARALQRNDALLAAGVNDEAVRRNLMEGFHESEWGKVLDPDEAVYKNLPQLDGEDLPTYEARTKPVRDILKQYQSEGDKLIQREIELGIRNPYQIHEGHYSPRQATRAAIGSNVEPSANWAAPRTGAMGDLPTTQVNAALEDVDFHDLAAKTEINPLSPEALKRPVPPKFQEYLENVGYEDLEDLVDWQARGMLSADPQRAGMNANAVMRTAIGMRDAPELTRTVLPGAAETNFDALNAARAYALEKYAGVPRETFDQMPKWLDEAKSLPALKKEWEELADTARQGDYAKSLPEQEAAIQLQLGNAEQAAEAYRDAKGRLDSREIFSRSRDEWFDLDRMTDDERTLMEFSQQRSAFDSEANRRRFADLTAQSDALQQQVAKLGQKTPILQMRMQDVGTKPRIYKQTAKELAEHEGEVSKLTQQLTEVQRERSLLESSLSEGATAKQELAAMEADFRQRGYFVKDEAQYLTDKELREIAALRNEADRVPHWRRKLEKVQERIAAGEREVFPAEQLDELQSQIGAAEVARANLAAMKLKLAEADDLIAHAKKYGPGKLFGNDPVVDMLGKKMHDRRRVAWVENAQEALARNATMTPQEGVKYVPLTEALRTAGASGKDATSMAQAVKQTILRGKEAGVIDPKIADNIAGPNAVATSGVRSDKLAAQKLRDQDLLALRNRLDVMRQGQINEVQQKLAKGQRSAAEAAQDIAAIEQNFRQNASAQLKQLAESPLPDVSAAGNVMRAKQELAKDALTAAEESRAAGLLDDETLRLEKDKIEAWLKSDTATLGPEADAMMANVRAANPIPNDGLLAIKNILVPQDFVDQLTAAKSLWENPKPEGTIGTVLDKIRQVTKAHFTLPHLGFHGRNVQGSAALYATLRAFDPTASGLGKITKPLTDMWSVLRGRGIPDAENFPQVKALGLKGKDAERWVLAQISSKGSLRGAGDTISEGIEPTFAGDIRRAAPGGETAEAFARNVPGNQPIDAKYFTEPFTKREGVNRLDPRKPEQFFATALGARVSNFTENLFRGASLIGLMRQGKITDEAAALMKAAFVDYGDLTKWERTFARRVIPFYSWLRHASVFAAKNLAEQPAGFNAQLARLARVSQQDAGFLPPQMGGSLAIPLGQEENGTQRYLSQMDFPVETLNKLIVGGRQGLLSTDTIKNSLRSLVSQTDPILKGGLELAFGKSSFRGRNLEDLESPTGRLAANLTGAEEPLWKGGFLDQALTNSPLSRYVGTAVQAGDKRKSWGDFLLNTTSGLRLSDVDMDKQRAISASTAAKELLKELGANSIEAVKMSKEDLAKLSPDEQEEARKLQALLNSLSKQRKKAEKK